MGIGKPNFGSKAGAAEGAQNAGIFDVAHVADGVDVSQDNVGLLLRPPLLLYEMASLVRSSLQLHHLVSYVSLYLKQTVEVKGAWHLA